MEKGNTGLRSIKRTVLEILKEKDADLDRLCTYPARRIVNPLIQQLNSTDEWIKWRAVTATGIVVSNLAEYHLESARNIMRRLMWHLNSESGSMGWGSAEALGEIMARHEKLASEYASILLTYIDHGDNFIENENLQKGVLWALGRLGQIRPHLLEDGAPLLVPFMLSKDTQIRGLAAWAARAINSDTTLDALIRLSKDENSFTLYLDGHLTTRKIRELAAG